LQRCIDDFRAGRGEALTDAARHVEAIESRLPSLAEAIPQAKKAIEALHASQPAQAT
jgi:hypothetical protein